MSIDRQISRRQERALTEPFQVKNLGQHPVFAPFEVLSPSGRTYRVVMRSFEQRVNSCTCPDFQTNLLGTCKHIEAVKHRVRKTLGKQLAPALAQAPSVTHVYLAYRDGIDVAITPPAGHRGLLGELVERCFDPTGTLSGDPATRLSYFREQLARLPTRIQEHVCVSPEVAAYAAVLADRRAIEARRGWFLGEVRAGRRSLDLLGTRLYPFQEQGALHLAFGRRAMLADAMGLGKTVQALAATVLLREMTGMTRALIVCPASLKHQWLREIARFTSLPAVVVDGTSAQRHAQYHRGAFFTIINYELAVRDAAVLERLTPDLVILDEAQRIKNWRTRTADAVKRLRSRYAFVLTGTPLENNLDELYSVMQFLDPRILGPLWQFNHRYYLLERRAEGDRYKVVGHKNLHELQARLAPVALRRTAQEVALELPPRLSNNYFVEMHPEQLAAYDRRRATVAGLCATADRRPLSPRELDVLQRTLTTMRLLCNALELGERKVAPRVAARTAPKLEELSRLFDDHLEHTDRKAIVFSSFEGMIDLAIARVATPRGMGAVKLSGTVPARKRGALVDRFRSDPSCRVFFATDAGAVGLNLESASLVINLDVPWNPAIMEQRIGRAHRIGQACTVNVVNLVARGTIEERILDALAAKQALFAGVFAKDSPDQIVFDGRRGVLTRLREILATAAPGVEAGDGQAVPSTGEMGTAPRGSVSATPYAHASNDATVSSAEGAQGSADGPRARDDAPADLADDGWPPAGPVRWLEETPATGFVAGEGDGVAREARVADTSGPARLRPAIAATESVAAAAESTAMDGLEVWAGGAASSASPPLANLTTPRAAGHDAGAAAASPAAARPAVDAHAGPAAAASPLPASALSPLPSAPAAASGWVLDRDGDSAFAPGAIGAAQWIVTAPAGPAPGVDQAIATVARGPRSARFIPELHGDVARISAPRPRAVAAVAGRLAVALTGALGGRILLVKLVPSIPPFASGDAMDERVLIVVDRDAADLAATIETIAAQTLGTEHAVALHVFDRAGFAGLQALLGAVIDSDDLAPEAYRSAALPRRDARDLLDPSAHDARVKTAHALLDTARERLKLSRVILDAGFARDAVAPLIAALDGGLMAMLSLVDETFRGALTASALERLFDTPGLISPDLAARLPVARGLLVDPRSGSIGTGGARAPAPPDAARLARIVQLVEELHSHVRARVVSASV